MIRDSFIEHLSKQHSCPAYIDETGCGAIFGPIVACAVIIPEPFDMIGVNDSKQLKHEVIYQLAPLLKRRVIYGLGIVTGQELQNIRNCFKGDMEAMRRAVSNLPKTPDAVFIDGKYAPSVSMTTYTVVKGDTKVFGIAVASIIAKDYRDHVMMEKYRGYRKYHIAENKGYRSPDHLMAIRKYGVIEGEHRTWVPQIQRVLSGSYDRVIMKKYHSRWESLA